MSRFGFHTRQLDGLGFSFLQLAKVFKGSHFRHGFSRPSGLLPLTSMPSPVPMSAPGGTTDHRPPPWDVPQHFPKN